MNVSKTDKVYLWLDLETNGKPLDSYWELGQPLEIAFVITDDKLQGISEPFTQDIHWPRETIESMRNSCNDAVRLMHDANGLWEDCAAEPTYNHKRRVDEIARMELDEFFNQWATKDRTFIEANPGLSVELERPRLILAGSGVSHFDNRWLKHHFPLVWEVIDGYDHETKPTIDVGVLRRFFKDFTDFGSNGMFEKHEESINHRALDDVYQILNEARFMRDALNHWYHTHIAAMEH